MMLTIDEIRSMVGQPEVSYTFSEKPLDNIFEDGQLQLISDN